MTGAELLVRGSYQMAGSGLQADFRLYDVQQRQVAAGETVFRRPPGS